MLSKGVKSQARAPARHPERGRCIPLRYMAQLGAPPENRGGLWGHLSPQGAKVRAGDTALPSHRHQVQPSPIPPGTRRGQGISAPTGTWSKSALQTHPSPGAAGEDVLSNYFCKKPTKQPTKPIIRLCTKFSRFGGFGGKLSHFLFCGFLCSLGFHRRLQGHGSISGLL